jgi:hypothetical protein
MIVNNERMAGRMNVLYRDVVARLREQAQARGSTRERAARRLPEGTHAPITITYAPPP